MSQKVEKSKRGGVNAQMQNSKKIMNEDYFVGRVGLDLQIFPEFGEGMKNSKKKVFISHFSQFRSGGEVASNNRFFPNST